MTVSENINPKVILEGPFDNGAELVFNFPYADPEHIKVKEDDTLLTYNVDYEVLSHSIEGPTPVLSQVVKLKKAVTGNVTIYRVTPIDQQAEFPQAQKFNSGKLNEALDKICMQQQEQQEAIDRSLKITNSLVGTFDLMLPTPSANDVLRWDVTGSKLENYDIKEFEAGVQAQIDIIEDTANTAATNASTAVSTANTATVIANSASSTASTAATNASAAVSTANEASTTANTASAVASAASTTATNAKSTADTAAAKVDQFGESIGAVIEVAGKINELEEGITTATSAATTATNAANTASAAAESATSAAATATAKAEEVSQALVTKEDKANKGVAGGYASLGEDGKVPAEQLAVDLSTVQQIAEKGVANGYAELDADGKVPKAQLPNTSSGLEVCDIGMALYVDETKGLRRYLNGQIVDINTNTQAFLNRLQQITTLHPSLLCTEEEWQTAKTSSAFGQVGKFVFNYSGDDIVSVRIPRVVNVQGLFDLQNLGMTVSAGLPNIEGSTTWGANGITTTSFGNQQAFSESIGALFVSNTNSNYGGVGGQGADTVGATRVSIDASRSNPIYGNSNTVQQEAIQYPYFIQIATGSETENNIINDIELNNPYSLFDSKYSDHELNNLSWLKSEGQWNAKATYPTAYDKLLKVYNGTETVEGLSVKLSTETYTDYDFVLNTVDETFRLPLKTLHSDDTVDSLSLYFYVGETVQNANLIDAGRIGEQLAGKANIESLNKKVEVEALLNQNGYAKFTWKEGNSTHKLLMQWGLNSIGTSSTVNLPTSFSSTSYTLVNAYDNVPSALFPAKVTRQSNTSFVATANYGGNPVTCNIGWFAIGT